MKLHRVKYFVAAVERGTLSSASRILNVAQPALSQQLSALDDDVGVQLLDRGPRGVAPTEAGEIFYQHAMAILNQVNMAVAETVSAGKEISGDVLIMLSATTSQLFLPGLINRVYDRFPKVRLHFNRDEGKVDFIEALLNGRADLAILPEIPQLPEISCEILAEIPIFLFGSKEMLDPLEGPEGQVAFSKLADVPLVLPAKKHPFRAKMEYFAVEQGVEFNTQAEASDAAILSKYIETWRFCSLLPKGTVSLIGNSANLKSLRVTNPHFAGNYCLYQSQRRSTRRCADAVADMLRSEAQDIISSGKT